MQCAAQAHRDLAFRAGGILVSALLLLLWPASAYGSPGSAGHRQATTSFPSPCTCDRAATALPLDSHLTPSRPALVHDTAALLDVSLTGAWARAHQYVGSPDEHHYSQEQMAAFIARTPHLSS